MQLVGKQNHLVVAKEAIGYTHTNMYEKNLSFQHNAKSENKQSIILLAWSRNPSCNFRIPSTNETQSSTPPVSEEVRSHLLFCDTTTEASGTLGEKN